MHRPPAVPRRRRLGRRLSLLCAIALLPVVALQTSAAAAAPPSGPCAFPTRGTLSGPDPEVNAPGTGILPALMLFVDFPDAVATSSDSPQALEDKLVPGSTALFSAMSYGALDLRVTSVRRWIRMPHDSASYPYARGLTFEAHQRYLRDAVAAADPTVDFSGYRILYVVPVPSASNISFSPAFSSYAGDGLFADGNEIRNAVSLGQDLAFFGSQLINHESGHLLGLPDLYDNYTSDAAKYDQYVGQWDLMGSTGGGRAPGYLAYHRWVLGWLAPDQVVCAGAAEQDVVLSPVSAGGGTKLVVRRDGETAVVAEYRRALGEDSDVCREGLLVTRLDNRVASGAGPARVVDARPRSASCGDDALDDAPFGGDVPRWVGSDGSGLTVLSQTPDALTVRVSPPGSFVSHRVPSIALSATGPVDYGTLVAVTITGTPGAAVDLYSRLYPNADYTRIRSGLVLDDSGRTVVQTRPNYNLRLKAVDPEAVGDGNPPLVQVRKRMTLNVSCDRTRSCTLSGSANPFNPGQVVDVRRSGTAMRRVSTSSSGAWSVRLSLPRGTSALTATSPSTGYNAGSTSPSRTVRLP